MTRTRLLPATGRFGLRFGALLKTGVDLILERNKEPRHQKRTRWEDRHQKGVVHVEDLPAPGFRPSTEQQLHVGKECACAEEFTYRTQATPTRHRTRPP